MLAANPLEKTSVFMTRVFRTWLSHFALTASCALSHSALIHAPTQLMRLLVTRIRAAKRASANDFPKRGRWRKRARPWRERGQGAPKTNLDPVAWQCEFCTCLGAQSHPHSRTRFETRASNCDRRSSLDGRRRTRGRAKSLAEASPSRRAPLSTSMSERPSMAN